MAGAFAGHFLFPNGIFTLSNVVKSHILYKVCNPTFGFCEAKHKIIGLVNVIIITLLLMMCGEKDLNVRVTRVTSALQGTKSAPTC
jgi:hypothetical protein